MRPLHVAKSSLGHFLVGGAAMLCLMLPRIGLAQEQASFWDFADEAENSFARNMKEADTSALASVLPDLNLTQRLDLAQNAIASYNKAIKADPSEAEPHIRAAETISRHYLQGPKPDRVPLKRAIEHWRAFEAKAPDDPRMIGVLNERSIALTKLFGLDRNPSDLEDAIVDYDKEAQLLDQSSPAEARRIATLLSNRAELEMMLGRLDEAIKGYEQSIEFSDEALAGYGLAVALDRDGQRTRARNVARVHAQNDRVNRLVEDGTFFVPAGEEFYYFGMRYEGLGDYRSAVASYREYLQILPKSAWAPMARKNLEELLPKAVKQPVNDAIKRGHPLGPWP